MYKSTNLRDTTTPNTKQFSGMIAGAHTASQWRKPVYHHSLLTESARPEHEPIPKIELSISHNPSRYN